MCFDHNYFLKSIVITIWTIVQTSVHIIFVLAAYYICQLKPTNYLLIVLYMTYFYSYDNCGPFSRQIEDYLMSKNSTNPYTLIDLRINASDDEDDIYRIVHTVMEEAIFPRETSTYNRTQFYLLIYIIYDGCWLLSSFLLFVAISFHVKKGLSTLFYGPWLLLTGLGMVIDATAAVHFGLDLLQIHNYTSWLKFIGISNYKDFTKFNDYHSAHYIPHISSIAMATFFARIVAFWVLNIANFFAITTHFASALRGHVHDNNLNYTGRRPRSKATDGMNSSESRIRKWQMFYGTVHTTSSASSSSLKSENDLNSPQSVNLRMSITNRKISDDSPRPVAGNSTTRYSLDSNIEYLSSSNSSPKITSTYMKFPDVVDGMERDSNRRRRSSTDSIRRDVPWSYLRHNEKPPSILGNYGESSSTNSRDKLVHKVAEEREGTDL